jgi:hypothetical protein
MRESVCRIEFRVLLGEFKPGMTSPGFARLQKMVFFKADKEK